MRKADRTARSGLRWRLLGALDAACGAAGAGRALSHRHHPADDRIDRRLWHRFQSRRAAGRGRDQRRGRHRRTADQARQRRQQELAARRRRGIPPAGRRREAAGDHLDHDRRDRPAVPALARDRHADDLRRRDHAGDPQGRTDRVLQLSAGGRRGKEIAEYIIRKLGHKTAAIIYENSSYGKTLSSIFIEEFKKLGGTIFAEEVIEKGGRDFRSQITRIGATNPPVTVTYAYYAEGGLIVRQAAELGVKTAARPPAIRRLKYTQNTTYCYSPHSRADGCSTRRGRSSQPHIMQLVHQNRMPPPRQKERAVRRIDQCISRRLIRPVPTAIFPLALHDLLGKLAIPLMFAEIFVTRCQTDTRDTACSV